MLWSVLFGKQSASKWMNFFLAIASLFFKRGLADVRWILKWIHSLACIYPKNDFSNVWNQGLLFKNKSTVVIWTKHSCVTNTVRTMPCYMFVSHYCFKIVYNYLSNSGFRPFQACYEAAFRLETLRSEVKSTHHARRPEIQWWLRHCRGTRGWYGWSE